MESFCERRALRILPPFALIMILATYFGELHWGKNILWYLLFAMNFAETFHKGLPGLGILWSLAVEEQFYLFWPIVALHFSPRTVKRVALALIFLAALLRGVATPFLHEHWAIYYLMPFRMDLLASGAVMAVLWQNPGSLATWRRWGLILMAGGLLVFGTFVVTSHNFRALANNIRFNVFGYSTVCCVATGLIAFTLGTERGWWMWLTTARPVRWLGMVSYSAYLVHSLAIGILRPFPSRNWNFALDFVVTIGYSTLSWVLIEKPILKLRPAAWLRQRKKQTV